ncbi:hypothetical protein NT6N_04310 [Oceaniferula spumae]|uniref:Uncharacterized protein n=1 Tax=Oceaniferula spumae TaxID=2979115 RepID=A0AAT9FHD3_9BACT
MHRLTIYILLLIITPVRADEPRTWIGPHVKSINTLDGGTLFDVVEKIRIQIKNDTETPIAVRIDVSDDELRKVPAKVALKKIPAVVALSYAADIGGYEFLFQNGVWVLRNTPLHQRVYPGDTVALSTKLVTRDELRALGLAEAADGKISVQQGAKWPKLPEGKITRIKDAIVIIAQRQEIDNFHALLQLHRRGYRIPTINSEQGGAHQSTTRPESKSE